MESVGFARPALNAVSQNRKREAGPFIPGPLTTQRSRTGGPRRGRTGRSAAGGISGIRGAGRRKEKGAGRGGGVGMHEDAGQRDEDSRQGNASSGTKGKPQQEEESPGGAKEGS